MGRRSVRTRDNVTGKIKRAVGKPDLVFDGKAQDTGCRPEDAKISDADRGKKVLPPRHQSIGIEDEIDEISEHEDERLNPGGTKGSASGAGADRPSGPSNSS